MGASERPRDDAEREPEGDEAGRQTEGVNDVPLFLRDRNDGRKGDAQDEKDEVGE